MLKENMISRVNCYQFFSSFLCLIFFLRGNSEIIELPADTVTRVGDSAFFRCASDTPGDIHWYHFRAGLDTSGRNYVYAYGDLFPPYNERFRVEHKSSRGTSNLIIQNVELDDAGLFVCQEFDGAGETAKAQLIVLESDPVCATNIDPNGFIGPNDCGLHPDYIDISCVVYYKGFVTPKINWTKVHRGKTYAIDQSHSECDVHSDRISYNYRAQIDMTMDGTSFACDVIQKAQFKCNTDVVKVQYAKEINHTPIAKDVGDSVICSAKASASDVKYKWMRRDDVGEVLVSENNTLKITEPGLYLCKINYHLKHYECSSTAMNVIAISRSEKTREFPAEKVSIRMIIPLAGAFTALLLILALVGFLGYKRRKGRKRQFNKKVTEDCKLSEEF